MEDARNRANQPERVLVHSSTALGDRAPSKADDRLGVAGDSAAFRRAGVNYHALAKLDRLVGRVTLPVKDSPPFFKPDQAVNTFFFLGAGVGEYKPEVFSWVKGALAVNLDRVSAPSLRDRKASWVAAALGAHVCGAIGNVADPGPDGVPSVANLFHTMKADSTWAETAYTCIPYLCGQTIVIGDPLYTPLK